MLHWKCDDLFVLPELEDLEKCLREDYDFDTDIFSIPDENAHLDLMLKIGDMVKKDESEDTLFVVYYGGHARIDESRQSTWCATRRPGSPSLQWSAIQTLLERSISDVLILLDCCAGAASATFPTGQSITETISASSWDAIAPDPGRYSFTNALIEVLQEWRLRTFSAAMLHAEVLARLKHPRPILINGKHFEARATPVHFMMTSNHKAPSIEIGRLFPDSRRPPSPPHHSTSEPIPIGRRVPADDRTNAPFSDGLIPGSTEPNENEPHVMISLALEDDQRLDLNAWEEWLANFPAIAKYVKVQGVFKSHSTLLLLSLPVMVWDLLPDDPACAFIAFIRSNNLLHARPTGVMTPESDVASGGQDIRNEPTFADGESLFSGETLTPSENPSVAGRLLNRNYTTINAQQEQGQRSGVRRPAGSGISAGNRTERFQSDAIIPSSSLLRQPSFASLPTSLRNVNSATPLDMHDRQETGRPSLPVTTDHNTQPSSEIIPPGLVVNRYRSTRRMTFMSDYSIPDEEPLASHVVKRLEELFQKDPEPTLAFTELLASNFGVETSDIHLWYYHRREQERMTDNLQRLGLGDHPQETRDGARMILPGHLNTLLEIYPSKSVLIIDLRSSTDFERSHIHEAVNLRAPLSFVQHTSLEMIEDTLVDDQSRRSFSKWSQSRCVVFYDRVIEFDWECPVADALYEKLRRKGWQGQCFVLKGHYREFSASFDRYISGSKMSKDAKEYLDGLRQRSSPTQEEASRRHERYGDWLRAFESEDRVPVVDLIPARKFERTRALEQRQKELEAEFETRFPALYRKAQSLRPVSPSSPTSAETFGEVRWNDNGGGGDNFDRKAPLVGPLASGLDKMREASGLANVTTAVSSDAKDVGGGGGYSQHHSNESYVDSKLDSYPPDDYDEIDPKTEGWKNDPAFQRAGIGAGTTKLQETVSSGSGSAGGGASSGADDGLRKGRKRPLIWERLRSGGK
ncbi:hypothetical protein B0T17DRAFT_589438 [Bombardia bombarda]|uniref:Homeobox domain-containing protein n=1 Tax=Bombardia bombarda TaxID=252184 RepID=A0AA39XA98_9PEZI|nr:hypothetical protein B0T17DRAFT_589438 [Bombardia bombarda]